MTTPAQPLPPTPQVVKPQAPMEALDIISFITSLLGLAIIPLTLGLMSRSEASKQGLRQHSIGAAGLIIGAIECALWVCFWIMVAIGMVMQAST